MSDSGTADSSATAATEVSMLWEAVDPASALSTRFGFTDADHAVSWLASALREEWARQVDRCDRLVLSAGNLLGWFTADGRRVIVKCCAVPERFARLHEVDALVTWLDDHGVPVAAPIAAGGGRPRIERDHRSIALYPVIEGELLDVTDPAQVEEAGRTLATLHRVLATYPGRVGSRPTLPNEQLIHGDFRSANILCAAGRITAVLDFDEAAHRSRVADVARSAVLLGTRYRNWAPTDPLTRDAFVAAYDDVAPLTGAERDELGRSVSRVLTHLGWS